jgi:hypothetical protein
MVTAPRLPDVNWSPEKSARPEALVVAVLLINVPLEGVAVTTTPLIDALTLALFVS